MNILLFICYLSEVILPEYLIVYLSPKVILPEYLIVYLSPEVILPEYLIVYLSPEVILPECLIAYLSPEVIIPPLPEVGRGYTVLPLSVRPSVRPRYFSSHFSQ